MVQEKKGKRFVGDDGEPHYMAFLNSSFVRATFLPLHIGLNVRVMPTYSLRNTGNSWLLLVFLKQLHGSRVQRRKQQSSSISSTCHVPFKAAAAVLTTLNEAEAKVPSFTTKTLLFLISWQLLACEEESASRKYDRISQSRTTEESWGHLVQLVDGSRI